VILNCTYLRTYSSAKTWCSSFDLQFNFTDSKHEVMIIEWRCQNVNWSLSLIIEWWCKCVELVFVSDHRMVMPVCSTGLCFLSLTYDASVLNWSYNWVMVTKGNITSCNIKSPCETSPCVQFDVTQFENLITHQLGRGGARWLSGKRVGFWICRSQVQIPAVTLFQRVISLSKLFTHIYSGQLSLSSFRGR